MKNLKIKSAFIVGLLLLAQSSFCFAQPHTLNFEINPSDDPTLPPRNLSYEIKPTLSVEDVMTVKNNDPTKTLNLKVYAVDSLQSSDGVVAFKLSGAPQENIGMWLKLNENEISVPPLKSVMIPYTISIPEKVTPGTYQGALIGEIIGTDDGIEKSSIKVATRLTNPLYISIPGRKEVNYSLDEFRYEENRGKPGFYIKFSNKGNVFLKSEVNLHVEGLLLRKPYDLSLNHPTILQGESYEKAFSFENPPLFGSYKATLSFKVFEYNIATGELKELQTITRDITFGIIPYTCIAVFIILVILIVLAERWRRKHLKDKLDDTFIHTVVKGETITSIADLYQIDWKKIVKLNKLTKPYTLRSGKKLILPFPKPSKEVTP